MTKIDLKRDLKPFYRPTMDGVSIVDVPLFNFLMIDGEGDPNASTAYSQAVEALFSVSYAVKFMLKRRADPIDYVVMPLEGLWWAEDMSVFIDPDRSRWHWTMMIMQPDFVSAEAMERATSEVARRKALPAIERLRFEPFAEGRCAQIVHVGPFSEEGPTVQRLHRFIAERSTLRGKHHEIYLSDVRRADPKRWKTIIRQPMQ
ncbi:MAG: GyrI-like domain-containing protein [Lautropia sp.]